jgi:hypothetical protein
MAMSIESVVHFESQERIRLVKEEFGVYYSDWVSLLRAKLLASWERVPTSLGFRSSKVEGAPLFLPPYVILSKEKSAVFRAGNEGGSKIKLGTDYFVSRWQVYVFHQYPSDAALQEKLNSDADFRRHHNLQVLSLQRNSNIIDDVASNNGCATTKDNIGHTHYHQQRAHDLYKRKANEIRELLEADLELDIEPSHLDIADMNEEGRVVDSTPNNNGNINNNISGGEDMVMPRRFTLPPRSTGRKDDDYDGGGECKYIIGSSSSSSSSSSSGVDTIREKRASVVGKMRFRKAHVPGRSINGSDDQWAAKSEDYRRGGSVYGNGNNDTRDDDGDGDNDDDHDEAKEEEDARYQGTSGRSTPSCLSDRESLDSSSSSLRDSTSCVYKDRDSMLSLSEANPMHGRMRALSKKKKKKQQQHVYMMRKPDPAAAEDESL